MSQPAGAGDLVLGIGRDNLGAEDHSEATAAQLEIHTNPIRSYDWGSVALMGALETDEDDDIYAGAGLSVLWNVSGRWVAEGSLAAGYYDPGRDGLDLGGNLQFRSLVGIGYRLSTSARISLAVSHISNAGIEDVNPGRDAVFLRYAHSF